MQLFDLFDTYKVTRKGIVFQIPRNPFSSCKFKIHSSGDGASWLTTLDVDQPHGEDFVEFNDIRIGIRSRMSQEHTTFADSTVGGIHKEGFSSVLGIHDGTPPAADGTALVGHGIIWDNTAVLWCSTAVAGASTSGDPTVLLMHPDKQWGGQDITWQGAHQFDASVEFLDPVDFTGPITVDGSCDFSDVFIEGDITIAGKVIVDGSADFSDVYIEGDLTVKGDFKVDSTATEFGKTAGIGLFYDPTVYAGGETCTIGNGFIMKMGVSSVNANTTIDVSFATPFPTAGLMATGSFHDDNANISEPAMAEVTVTGVSVTNASSVSTDIAWFTIGR